MKNILNLLILLLFCSIAFGQDSPKIERQIKVDIGAFLSTSSRSDGDGYSSGADNIYHIGIGYTLNFNERFYVTLGTRLDYYHQILVYRKDAYLASLLLQSQLNLRPGPKTFYLYGNYGMGPKFGGSFYAGSMAEFGVGWQYKPKFLGKKTLGLALGYNSTVLKNVFNIRYYSSGGINSETTEGYYKLRLKSLALNLGLSF